MSRQPRLQRPLLGLIAVLGLGAWTALSGSVPGDDIPEGFELVYYDGLDAQGRLTGGRTLAPRIPSVETTPAVPAPVTTLFGPSPAQTQAALSRGVGDGDNRVDLVFVGDGYTAAEMSEFQGDVDTVVAGLFSTEPLGRYANYFAVHRVDVVSNDSGVDNDPTQGINRDTAMDMEYWCGGTERLLCVNVSAAYGFANNAPAVDQIIALANSNKYGGAGYSSSNLATSAGGNGSAVEIVKHELGHSLGNLADEYTYGGPTNWTNGEPSRQNVSTFDSATMASMGTKWAAWLGANVAGFDGTVGTFEGANYSETGIYRPTNNSLMRSLGRPFNLVGAQEVIKQIYREVEPIDDASDPSAAWGEGDVLFVTPMVITGAPLDIQWSLDGVEVPGATSETLDISSLGLGGCTGTVSVTVRDNTTWLLDEAFRDARMTQSLSYSINTEWQTVACATTPNSVGEGAEILVTGSPSVSTQDLTLTCVGGPGGAACLFFYADTGVTQFLGDGTLCASGNSQRLGLTFFDNLGITQYPVDWNNLPISAGPTALTAGSTWIFQAWYRDAGAGGVATFDFSSAVQATFCE